MLWNERFMFGTEIVLPHLGVHQNMHYPLEQHVVKMQAFPLAYALLPLVNQSDSDLHISVGARYLSSKAFDRISDLLGQIQNGATVEDFGAAHFSHDRTDGSDSAIFRIELGIESDLVLENASAFFDVEFYEIRGGLDRFTGFT